MCSKLVAASSVKQINKKNKKSLFFAATTSEQSWTQTNARFGKIIYLFQLNYTVQTKCSSIAFTRLVCHFRSTGCVFRTVLLKHYQTTCNPNDRKLKKFFFLPLSIYISQPASAMWLSACMSCSWACCYIEVKSTHKLCCYVQIVQCFLKWVGKKE